MPRKKKIDKAADEPVDDAAGDIPVGEPVPEKVKPELHHHDNEHEQPPPLSQSDMILVKLVGSMENINRSLEALNVNMVNFATNSKTAFRMLDEKINRLGGVPSPSGTNSKDANHVPNTSSTPAAVQSPASAASTPAAGFGSQNRQMSPDEIQKLDPMQRQQYFMEQLNNNPFVAMILQAMMGQGGMGQKPSMFEEIGKRQVLMSAYTQQLQQKAIVQEWAKQGRISAADLQKHEQMSAGLYGDIERMAAATMQQNQMQGMQR